MLALGSIVSEIDCRIPKLRLCLVSDQCADTRRVFVREPADVAEILRPLNSASEEYFVSLHLNSKNEVLGAHEVSHGTLSTSLVHPREVYKAALLANSFAIVVCHNHPSGARISPSHDDYLTTKQLIRAGSLLGVSLVDHVILGPSSTLLEGFFSFRENHPELWNEAGNQKQPEWYASARRCPDDDTFDATPNTDSS
jgi:DNA repair protein RadC